MPDKKDIIILLDEIADIMEFNGENPFKIGAYRNGASAIRKTELDFNTLISSKKLDQVKGIGKGLQSVIYEYCERGSSTLYEELRKDVPAGIGDLLKIKGLGPKKIKLLHTELSINTLDELLTAAREGKLLAVKGFTQSASDKIIEEIDRVKVSSGYVLLNQGIANAEEIISRFSQLKNIKKIEPSGELRRKMEVFSVLEFEVLTSDKKKLLNEIKSVYPFEVTNNRLTVKDVYDIPFIFYISEDETSYVHQRLIHTGSKEFVSQYFSELPSAGSEEEIFSLSGKPFVIPEMREEEYLSVNKEELKQNSELTFKNFKGMLHFHTTYSDGRDTLEEMLNEAEKIGFEYLAVCDHSKSAYYVQGLTEDRIIEQTKHLKKLKKTYKLKLFQGVESDILQDGSLDYSDEFLSHFDFVAASIHSRFNMDEKEMTRRLIKAVENPNTDILGHPSGRQLLVREPYKFNVKKVIDACYDNQVAIEINANPRRLDLDWHHIYYARQKGCLFSINADAHSTKEIYLLQYGIMMGRKGGLQSSEVINCYNLDAFKEFLNRKVKRKFVV